MSENEYGQQAFKLQWTSCLVRSGFVLLGGVAGILIGALLFTYLVPFWYHTEIDVEDRLITDIVLVDNAYQDNEYLFHDDVIVQTEDGNHYSYTMHQWTKTK